MDLQKGKNLLDKINALYKNISSDPRNVSSIERDLMRSYIIQFYEAFLEMPTVSASVSPPPAPVVETKVAEPRITLLKPEPAPAPPVPSQPAPPKPEPVKVEPPKVEAAPAPAPPPPPVVVLPKEEAPAPLEPKTIEFTPTPRATVTADPEIEELFSFKTATELSEKLSELPISDIKKAMGLNERISTQNELFGGDSAAFDAALSTLNQLKSYEEAKDYLVRNVAGKFGWSSKEKKEKAKAFIKLVRRRY